MAFDPTAEYLVLLSPIRFPPSLAKRKEEKSELGQKIGEKSLEEISLENITSDVVAEGTVAGGGGTKKECAENLVKPGQENWNKWYLNTSNSSWIQFIFKEKLLIRGFGLKSANDCPERDPVEVNFMVFDSDLE